MTSSAEGIWDRISEDGQRGGIDPGHGAAQRYPHFGLPHPDAEALERAVEFLPDIAIDWGESRAAIMGDTEQLLTQRDVIMVPTLSLTALVSMHAKMGTRPDWHREQPRPQQVAAERGPHAKIVGECRGHNLYTSGSYCPLLWSPSALTIARARADYVAWWRGLAMLSESVLLSEHVALPPVAQQLPWLEPEREYRTIRIAPSGPQKMLMLRPDRGWYPSKERRRPDKGTRIPP